MTARGLRLAAYAVCRRQDRMLPARWISVAVGGLLRY
jgi:hypothetical protein